MTLLAQLRLSPRWLVLLVVFAALAVTTVALVPHDDLGGEDFDCLVCKAGAKPFTELVVEVAGTAPVVLASAIPDVAAGAHSEVPADSGEPRAPPV